MKHDPRLYLIHIVEMIDEVELHLKNGGRDAFYSNRTVQQATLRSLQLMGESVKRLPDTMKAEMPEIDWPKIGGFRNVLVHDYLGDIDLDTVWQVIENNLHSLKQAVNNYQERHYG